ncbi:glycosyltransferase involved in cell wall biosynthesis [Arcanobacterium wilhelmae]|uniref:Glycosyltransferase involved in cell wall biosynthesis n=1 Tax=Arcanobacterium wilhelmae TaxID=1803177 RepID=A0ABT9NDA8_9ACTO|nr:glycosyltransferase family 4 protein [Arcanobacterium wilhelmae]MDP9801704.1 glycosyltransferase involved in cell wall biosynthesis [Arcanobacterium wilhelmae]WFN91024.1 glycosyltransferase family 4 protein [Arcanobacterium wilhelmae]
MHVLFVAQQWAPEKGVPQRRGRWMVDQLTNAGHTVSIVAPPPHYPTGTLLSTAREDQAGAVTRLGPREVLYRAQFRPHTQAIPSRIVDQATVSGTSVRTALRSARDRRPDVVIATAPPLPTAFTAYTVAKRLGVPFVLDLRDAWPELVDYVASADGGEPSLARRAFATALHAAGRAFGTVVAHADLVLTTSRWHARQLAERGINARPLTNLLLLDLQSAPMLPATEPHSELRVLYTGTLGRAQGLENAIEAVRLAKNAGTDVHLRLVGTGAHEQRLRAVASDDVEFTRRVDRSEIPAHLAWCDTVLVHLKDWPPLTTTIPSKLFEAINSGRFVSAALAGEGAQLLERSGVGQAVAPMDAQALADLWISLASSPSRLDVGNTGHTFLTEELAQEQPSATFVTALEECARAR